MKLNIIVFLLALVLSACVSKPITPIKIDTPINLDPRVFIPCNDLIVPESPLTFDSLLASSITNAELYLDCRNKQGVSIELLRQFSNKKEKR